MECLCVNIEFISSTDEQYQVLSAMEMAGIGVRIVDSRANESIASGMYILVVGEGRSVSLPLLRVPDLVISYDPTNLAVHGLDLLVWPGNVSVLSDQISDWFYSEPVSLPIELNMVGGSQPFNRLVDMIKRVAEYSAPAFVRGETGTGKEVAARAIHYLGAGQNGPFIPVNCGAYNDDLFVAELFGYERGAFTDAKQKRVGLVRQAEHGTLFLDEIDSLSAKAQVALLRFMQDKEYRPLGSDKVYKADLRIITASNQNMELLVEGGRFREDLFYRLDILGLEIPPLRERSEDIQLLAEHFLERLSRNYAQPIKYLSSETRKWMLEYPWPGNIRELENYLHKLFILTAGTQIHVCDPKGIPQTLTHPPAEQARQPVEIEPFSDSKSRAIAHFEQGYLDRVLTYCKGNISQAARLAGKERRAFTRLIEKHGIQREQYLS